MRYPLSTPPQQQLGKSVSDENEEVFASNLPSDAAPVMPTPPQLRRSVQEQPRKRRRRKKPTSAIDQRRESGVSVPIREARDTRTSEDSSLIVGEELLRSPEGSERAQRRVPNTDELNSQRLNDILASEDYRNAVYDTDFDIEVGEDEQVTEQFRVPRRSNGLLIFAGLALLSIAVVAGALIMSTGASQVQDQVWISSRPQGATVFINGMQSEYTTPTYIPTENGASPIISLELSGYTKTDARPLNSQEVEDGALFILEATP